MINFVKSLIESKSFYKALIVLQNSVVTPTRSANGTGKPRVRARRGQATDPHSIAERVGYIIYSFHIWRLYYSYCIVFLLKCAHIKSGSKRENCGKDEEFARAGTQRQ